jgi:PAS domain S-box-containing protein
LKQVIKHFYKQLIKGGFKIKAEHSTSQAREYLLRRFLVERGIFILGIFGELLDGIISGAIGTESGITLYLRVGIILLSGLFLFLSYTSKWYQRYIVLFGYFLCYCFSFHAAYLLIENNFSFDTAILFMGTTMICGLFFRSFGSLLLFIVVSFGFGYLAMTLVENPTLDPVLFLKRLYLIAVAAIALAQLSKYLQRRILRSNKELEKTVEELENLSVVASNTDNAVTITDAEGKIEWVNEGFSKLTGYALDEIEGKNLDDMFLNQYDQNEQKELEKKKGQKQGYSIELKRYRKDGTFYWSLINVTPVYSGIGTIRKYISIEKDISDRKKLEEELLNANNVQQTILDGTEYAIISTDTKGRIRTFNKGAQTLWSRSAAETSNVVDIFDLFDFTQDSYRQFINRLQNDKAVSDERTAKTPLGLIPVLLSATALANDAEIRTGYLFVAYDISSQKEAEKALIESESNYRQLIEYGQALVMIHDSKGIIRDVNKRITEILGFPKKRMIGEPLEHYLEMESEKSINNYMLELIRHPSHRGVMRLKTVNYETVYWAYRSIRQKVGETEQVIVYAHDISERVKAEKELLKAKTLAEETAKMKQQFLATMSHEIRTPMNAILGFSRLLLEAKLKDDKQEWAESIHLSAENLLDIINDILDFSKIEAGKMTLENTVFSFQDIFHRQEIIHRANAKEKGISLTFKVDDKLPANLYGDVTRLSQVLTNLLSNAIKFTKEGSVSLDVSQLEVSNNSMKILLKVTDTGIGIPENKKDKIFESFTQVQQDNNRLYAGTGLGLSIVKNIVDLMEGEITIESEVNKGTCCNLIIDFPIKKDASAKIEEKPKSSIEKVSLEGYKILLAEDNLLNQQLALNVLKNRGVAVDVADNGQIALDMHKKNDYDVILMDIQMPIMDGIEATMHIRSLENKRKAQIPIIALTAHALENEKDEYLAKGLNEVLSKPFKPDELAFVIAAHGKKQVKLATPDNTTIDKELDMNNDGPYDLSNLRAMTGSDHAFFIQMIKIFMEDGPVSLEVIDKAIEDQNIDTLNKESHKFKSSLKTMGLVKSGMAAKSLEDCIEQDISLADKNAHLKTIKDEVLQFIEYATKHII